MDFVAPRLSIEPPPRTEHCRQLHRECRASEVAQDVRDEDVVAALQKLRISRVIPAYTRIRMKNGPEFISMTPDRFAYKHGITLD